MGPLKWTQLESRCLGSLGVLMSDGAPKMDMVWVIGVVRGPEGWL